MSLDDVKRYLRIIVLYSKDSDCDLSQTVVQYLDGSSLDYNDLWKINRFVRLWRKPGWSMHELDAALMSLGYDDLISSKGIENLAQIKECNPNSKCHFLIFSLWANIDSHGEYSLYNKLFLNKSILKLDDVSFVLKVDGSDLLDGNQEISNHIPTLTAAFQIDSADFQLIRTDMGLDISSKTSKTRFLTLAIISNFYRYAVTVEKALKLKIKELITLKNLTGRDPFSTKSPSETIAFVNIIREIQSSGFSIAELNYIYRHTWDPSSGLFPSPEGVELLVGNLQDGLKKIVKITYWSLAR